MKNVASAGSFKDPREPPLFVGNWVRLNSGSPRLLVVENDLSTLTVAWRDDSGAAHELTLPPACLHRIASHT
jgi:hypothetical protein